MGQRSWDRCHGPPPTCLIKFQALSQAPPPAPTSVTPKPPLETQHLRPGSMTSYLAPILDPAKGEIMETHIEPRHYRWHRHVSKAAAVFAAVGVVLLLLAQAFRTLAVLVASGAGALADKWLGNYALAKWQNRACPPPPSTSSPVAQTDPETQVTLEPA